MRGVALAFPALAFQALALPALAATEDFVVEPAHTFASFAVDHLGVSTQRGRFERTAGRIVIDREAGTGSIEITIDAASVSTGNAALDAVLRSGEFFDVARHPEVRFRARAIAFEDGVPRRATGELTLAGVTHPLDLNIVRFGCTRLPFLVRLTCGADVAAGLSRSAFGLSALKAFVGDEVRLEIQVEAIRQEKAAVPATDG